MITSLPSERNCNMSSLEAEESPLDVLSRAATMLRQESQQAEEANSKINKQTTKWKRDRRRLPEYTRKSDPKIPETFGIEPSSPEESISNGLLAKKDLERLPHGGGDAPLDMTMRQRGEPPSYAQTINNPSYRSNYRTSVVNNGVSHPPVVNNREKLPSGISMCDTVIEEHFRRSLGQDYHTIFRNNKTKEKEIPSKSIVENLSSNTIEVMDDTGLSVDDHFAKALGGDTWKKLNQKESIKNRDNNESSLVSAKN